MTNQKDLTIIITEYLTKHPITEKLRNIGKSGKWTTSTNSQGEKTYTITYKDGTELTFTEKKVGKDKYNTITHVKHGDFDEDFQLHNGENFFNESKLYSTLTPDERELFEQFTYYKMSNLGMAYNRYLRGQWDEDDLIAEFDSQINDYELFSNLKGNDAWSVLEWYKGYDWDYGSILDNMSLNGYGDFFTVRSQQQLHDNDSLSKRIVSDDGYSSETIGAITEEYDSAIGIDSSDNWTIITLYKDGNVANRGAYLGYAEMLNEGHNYWEEVLRPPGSKSERLLIDEKNRIIVQEPYEP